MAGGTGSGLSSLVLSKVKDTFGDLKIVHQAVFHEYVGQIAQQPYNTLLCLEKQIEMSDLVVCFDNGDIS